MKNEMDTGVPEVSLFRASGVTVVLANLVPLAGVFLWGWSTFSIVLIYWAENVVLGAINLLKMLFCGRPAKVPSLEGEVRSEVESRASGEATASLANVRADKAHRQKFTHAAKLFFMPFFAVHFGGFCFVHGVFVFELLGDRNDFGFPSPRTMFAGLVAEGLLWPVAALTAGHLFSLVVNYLGNGAYRRTTLERLMFQPYLRIVPLHVALILGMFATLTFGSPVWILIVLILLKTAFEVVVHRYQQTQ